MNRNLWERETEIVWICDPQIFPFVREVRDYTRKRLPPKSTKDFVVVGYGKIPDAPEGRQHFRWFMVKMDEMDEYDDYENYPWIPELEWVDPLTVEPCVWGRWTGRKLTVEQKAGFESFMEAYRRRRRIRNTKRQQRRNTKRR